MYCQKCGAQVDDQAAFCDKCGAALTSARPTVSAFPAAGPGPGVAAPLYPAAVQYAGFWRRLGAAVIDGLIMAPVSFLIELPLGISPFSTMSVGPNANPEEVWSYLASYLIRSSIASGLSIVVVWLYYSLMESSKLQATVGKMVLGIVVTDMNGQRVSFGRATGRYFAKIISYIILLIGFLMVAFTPKKQGLHDIIASCLVVVKK